MWHFEQNGSLGVGNEGATAIAGPPARLWQGSVGVLGCDAGASGAFVGVLGCDAGGSGASSGGCGTAFLPRVAEARRGLLAAALATPTRAAPFSCLVASLLAGGVAANAAPSSSLIGTSCVSIEGALVHKLEG